MLADFAASAAPVVMPHAAGRPGHHFQHARRQLRAALAAEPRTTHVRARRHAFSDARESTECRRRRRTIILFPQLTSMLF